MAPARLGQAAEMHRSPVFFNDTATTEIYTLSLHDALPICSSHPVFEHTEQPAPSQTKQVTSNRSEEHTSELQSHPDLVCRLLLQKKTQKQVLQLMPVHALHVTPKWRETTET